MPPGMLNFFVLILIATFSKSVRVPGKGDAGPAPLVVLPIPPVPAPVNETEPRLNAFQESHSTKTAILNYPSDESRVTITVGDDSGFQYTVNGVTESLERIAVSGEYFNDEVHRNGYARLFLVAEPSIIYYTVRPFHDHLDVYAQTLDLEEFYFEIYTPSQVSGYNLRHGQVNSTAILVTGPSRSAVHGRGIFRKWTVA